MHGSAPNRGIKCWEEYLLYNAKRGFCFLVDAEDGWSLVKPITGAPTLRASDSIATYLGKQYLLQYSYEAETSYVAGEFYWQVRRGQKTHNQDFAAGSQLLSMERTPTEVTWSSGSKLGSDLVAKAFGLDAKKELLRRADAAPLSASSGMGCGTILIIAFLLIILLVILTECSSSGSSSGYRSSGGSWGGYSSGGGHK